LLKEKSIQSFKIWPSLGKPHMGTDFEDMLRDKAAYKHRIRSK